MVTSPVKEGRRAVLELLTSKGYFALAALILFAFCWLVWRSANPWPAPPPRRTALWRRSEVTGRPLTRTFEVTAGNPPFYMVCWYCSEKSLAPTFQTGHCVLPCSHCKTDNEVEGRPIKPFASRTFQGEMPVTKSRNWVPNYL